MTPRPIKLTINGSPAEFEVAARVTLADALREKVGLTGTHLACEHGVCGACTVMVDGLAVRSCLMLGVQVDGCEIVTVEGLGADAACRPCRRPSGGITRFNAAFARPAFL
jgi:carbon-monoxide dehydrogenase small subunit